MFAWQSRLRSIVTHPLFPVLLVCALSFSLRMYRLQVPETYYFDEVYHGFTAVEYAKGNIDAYNPWASAPEGVAYEWVHPPLAKVIMSWSVMLFGPTSWAWRLPSIFFGTAVIGLTGALAWVWFRNARLALLASTFLALDGLMLVMSRLAMNDVFFLTFLLLTLIAYFRSWQVAQPGKWWIIMGLSLGAALSSKWTTVYVLPVLGADILWRWRQANQLKWPPLIPLTLSLVVMPPAVYLLSHFQYFGWGYTWQDFVRLQQQIWWYHTQLEATHPYQSIPLQWIFDVRPVWFYSGSSDSISRNIYALGNPVFFWSGLVAVITLVTQQLRRFTWKLTVPLLAYIMMWLPWSLSPRIMFFYHYLPALPFLAIILAHQLTQWEQQTPVKTKHAGMIITTFVCLMGLWLIYFFPQLTGIPVPAEWAERVYYFIPSWR